MNSLPEPETNKPGTSEPTNPSVAYEPKDVNAGMVWRFLIALLLTVLGAQVVVWGVYRVFSTRETRNEQAPWPLRAAETRILPPEPRLQGAPGHDIQPQEELKEMRAGEDAILNSYGWVDEKAGIARIPINEAMKVLLVKGLPTAPRAAGAAGKSASREKSTAPQRNQERKP